MARPGAPGCPQPLRAGPGSRERPQTDGPRRRRAVCRDTARGGAFGLQPNGSFSPTHFAVADFTKTLALEFTGVLCKVVDLDPTDPNPILRQKLIDELTSPDDTLQVGLPGD